MPGGKGNIKPSDNPKPFKKGQVGNPKGGPRKFITLMKAEGYKQSQITDTYSTMLSMTPAQLKEIDRNPDATILEKTIAVSLLKSYATKSLWNVETAISRSFGTPKQFVETEDKTVRQMPNITINVEKEKETPKE